MRKEIESRMGIRATDIYGLSEVIGPGVASGCEAQNGLHIFDDHQETLAFLGIDPEVTEAMLAEYLSRRQAAFEETSENL